MNNSDCHHGSLDLFSGDLICSHCGQVIKTNVQMYSGPSWPSEKDAVFDSSPQIRFSKMNHDERSEAALRKLARELIYTFSLKASYEAESLNLMHQYWESLKPSNRYGQTGNRLLVACFFLLARRDGLAVNFPNLANSIQSTVPECGRFIEILTAINPSLKTSVEPQNYLEYEVKLVAQELEQSVRLVFVSEALKELDSWAGKLIALITKNEELPFTTRQAESLALAAAWLSFSAFFHSHPELVVQIPDSDFLKNTILRIVEESSLSFKRIQSIFNQFLDILIQEAKLLMPSTFVPLPKTKALRTTLLFDSFPVLIRFL